MSLVACSSGNSSSSNTADTTAAAAAEDTKAEGGDTAAAGDSEDYGDYNWNLAMTVSETTTNYKMVEYFANLVKRNLTAASTSSCIRAASWQTPRSRMRPVYPVPSRWLPV